MAVIVGVPCFHKFEKLVGINVKKCEFKLATDRKWYHVIYFKEPLVNAYFRWCPSIKCVHNTKNEVTEMWECVSSVAISSLHNISLDTHAQVLNTVLVQVIKYVTNLVKDEIVNLALVCAPSLVGRNFLENVASIICVNDTLQFMQMNRFTLRAGSSYKVKSKKRLLRKQLSSIFIIVKQLFFTKTPKRADTQRTTTASCTDTCKLKCHSERFLHADYTKLHWFFCRVHSDNIVDNLLQFSQILGDHDVVLCVDEAVKRIN